MIIVWLSVSLKFFKPFIVAIAADDALLVGSADIVSALLITSESKALDTPFSKLIIVSS